MTQWHDLNPDAQAEARRFADCFMLTSGAHSRLDDDCLQGLLHMCLKHFFQQMRDIGFSRRDLLLAEISSDNEINTRRTLTLMIMVGCSVLGQRPTRQILSQALEDMGTLEDMGDSFRGIIQSKLRKQR